MLKEWLIQYSKDVLNDEVVSCVKHKQACQRFLNDLENEGTDNFPYIFDEAKALRFFDWMRLFKHRKGVLQGQHIEPAPIQLFVFSNVYGWIHKDTGYRRFKKAYWQVARKNAKSQTLAVVGSYEASAFGESAAEVYCAATRKEQARIVWNEIDKMIKASPELKDKFKTAYGQIEHIKSDSIIRPLSKEDQKSGDGFDPQCGIIDEYHLHKTSEYYDVIDSGMVSRTQPLLMIITTAGFDLSLPCYRVEYKYVSDILNTNSPIENENYFVMINELDEGDDIKDESVWEKANPIVCSYPEGRKSIRDKLQVALDVPEKMRNFLTKNMNIWINRRENGYMDMSKWSACEPVPDEELRGRHCYVGVDLSKRVDLTSVAFIFPLDDGWAIRHKSFIPEDALQERKNSDNVPYDLWEKQGYLAATSGNVVDYEHIEVEIERMAKQNDWTIQEICYDPWNFSYIHQRMENKGYDMVEIRQGIPTLGEPTKAFRDETYDGNIYHNDDPLLTWAVGNAVTKMDAQENIMLDKSKSSDRIDPIAAVINGFTRAMYDEFVVKDLSAHFLSDDWGL